MDGVTDAPNRTMHGLYGRPDVVITEFTNVEGLWRGGDRIFRDFLYTPAERPVVAQIFGCQPEYFYKAAHVVCELGFDGLDINMGCPAKTIANKGGGAGLIRVPDIAKAIIRAAQKGVRDWANGQTLEDLEMDRERIKRIRQMRSFWLFRGFLFVSKKSTAFQPISRKFRGFASCIAKQIGARPRNLFP